jgi:hypothetical protein
MQKPKAIKIDAGLCDRFYEVFHDSQMGSAEFVNSIGLASYTYVNEIKKHVLEPSKSAIINACKVFNVSADWLLFGIGSKYRSGTEATLQQDVTETKKQVIKMAKKFSEFADEFQLLKKSLHDKNK